MATRQERIDRIREKHERIADRQQAEADRRARAFHAVADNIPLGQPILVGHHSEKRHRRDIERMQSNLSKSVAADNAARHHRAMAATTDGGGISVQDDDAQEQLSAEIQALEAKQDHMKRVNREWRKHKDLDKMNVSDATKTAIRRWLETREYSWQTAPFEGYQLKNNNANIRRLKRRQEEVERVAAIPDDLEVYAGTCEGKEFRFVTDTADERLRFESPRLSRDACKVLRQNGFKWSRTREAWIRLLNENAIGTAKHYLGPQLEKL